jgi:Alginate lyase
MPSRQWERPYDGPMRNAVRIATVLAASVVAASCGGGGGASGDPEATLANPSLPSVVPATPDTTATLLPPVRLLQFDLSRWKLDLPIDRFGGVGGAGGIQNASQTISTAQLLAGFVDAYFFADAQGRIVFTAPANGAVTSPGVGSDHTRSELREAYSGPGADANGNWSGNGTLVGTCAVLSVAPLSGSAVFAQLRSQSNTLALLVYRPATRDIAVDTYAANASGSGHTVSVLVRNVNLGDTINYSLVLSGAVLTATVNGTTRSSTLDASWVGAPLYFKLGAYHLAPNTGNGAADATGVAYSAFAVRH